MAIIGHFTAQSGAIQGTLRTLTLSTNAVFRPAEKEHDKAPDYRLHADELKIGAAWKRTSRDGRDYLSVKLDDPMFAAPVYATLVETAEDGAFDLIWSR